MAEPTRVAYLVSRYPHVSHTFIQREIQGIRDHGVEVVVHSVHRTPPEGQFSVLDQREAETTVVLRDRGVWGTLMDNVVAVTRRPGGYLRASRRAIVGAPPGAKALLWQVFYLAQAASLWRACRRVDVRHIHVHFANNAADMARLAAVIGSSGSDPWTWSFTMHGPTEFFDVTGSGLARKAREATFVSCISDFARSQLMSLVPPERWDQLHVVHCGVDADAFIPAPRSDRGVPLRVLNVGRLVPEKGLGVLLEAVARLSDGGVVVDLAVVGDGPLREQWSARAVELGVSDSVRFLGALGQDEVRQWIDWADVFCLPSFAEGVPVVLMEAMSCGLPVVTTRIAGIPELVEDGRSGILVPPGRPDAVSDALGLLNSDGALRGRMGRLGREAVIDRYSVADEARRLAGLFRDFAAQAGGGGLS